MHTVPYYTNARTRKRVCLRIIQHAHIYIVPFICIQYYHIYVFRRWVVEYVFLQIHTHNFYKK